MQRKRIFKKNPCLIGFLSATEEDRKGCLKLPPGRRHTHRDSPNNTLPSGKRSDRASPGYWPDNAGNGPPEQPSKDLPGSWPLNEKKHYWEEAQGAGRSDRTQPLPFLLSPEGDRYPGVCRKKGIQKSVWQPIYPWVNITTILESLQQKVNHSDIMTKIVVDHP